MNNTNPETNLDYFKHLWQESAPNTRKKWKVFFLILSTLWVLGTTAAFTSVAGIIRLEGIARLLSAIVMGPMGLLWQFLVWTSLVQESAQEPNLYWLLLAGINVGFLWLVGKILTSEPNHLVQEQRRHQAEEKAQGRLPLETVAEEMQISQGIPTAQITIGKKQPVSVGIDYEAGEGHMLVVGPTRSGKGLHLTQTLLQWPGAAIIVDPKGEQFERTAGARQERFASPIYRLPGHQVHLSYYYDYLKDRDSLIELHNHLLRPQESRDRIFADKSRDLLSAAAEFAAARKLNPLRVLLDGAENNPMIVLAALETVPSAKEYVRLFTDGLPPERLHENRFATSAYGTFTTMLGSYQKHVETIAPLRNSRQVIPRDWVAQGATIYITYSLTDLHGVGGVVAAIIAALMRYQIRQGQKERLLVAIDELPAIGLANITNYLATVGGYGISMLLYAQALSQLRQLYKPEGTQAILANCAHQVWYPPADIDTAKMMSELYGSSYKPSRSQGSSRRFYQGSSQESEKRNNYVDVRQAQSWELRPTLNPNEFMSLHQNKIMVMMHKERQYRFIGERINPIPVLSSLPLPPTLPQLTQSARTYTQWQSTAGIQPASVNHETGNDALISRDHY